MPPFRLELPDKPKANRSGGRLLHTKNTFDKRVKITDWEKCYEGFPIDNDPYCPGSLNFFLSHYNRFGFGPVEPYETTTKSMLNQVHMKDELNPKNPNKYLLNYFTYKDTLACDQDVVGESNCPHFCAADYDTTMQHSYSPPYPYRMQRFGFPVIPYLQNRRLKDEQPHLSPYTFFDEDFHNQTKLLTKHKSQRWISYNPMLAINSDGTIPKERTQKCFKLDYINERL